MQCKHKFITINSVSLQAHRRGSKKFKSGFEEAGLYGIKILVARQKQCSKCKKKQTTIEISKSQFDSIIESLPSKLESELVTGLTKVEKKVREYLIRVSKGEIDTRHPNKAMYKEVWDHIYPNRKFGRGNTNEVVGWIVAISNFDLANRRPPLNSLVVRGDTGMPGDSWNGWMEEFNSPFKNVEKAQQACWSCSEW